MVAVVRVASQNRDNPGRSQFSVPSQVVRECAMDNVRPLAKRLPNPRIVTIIAQDPSVRVRGKILYRVSVVDYDSSTGVLYQPAILAPPGKEKSKNAKGAVNGLGNKELLDDPRFHARNVYAIMMRILARFEFALGRRVAWGSAGHQIHVALHAFAEANAFYSREDCGIFFGYFRVKSGEPIFTCLSHDVVAHETTHAILDCLRSRYLEPSSPDQAAFHEGFADIVALLSVFSMQDVVGAMLGGQQSAKMIGRKQLTRDALLDSVLLGLADQMGAPGKPYMSMPNYQEPHNRGELLVAAITFFSDYLSALLTVDREVVPDDSKYGYRDSLLRNFKAYDISPADDADADGTWKRFDKALTGPNALRVDAVRQGGGVPVSVGEPRGPRDRREGLFGGAIGAALRAWAPMASCSGKPSPSMSRS